MDSDIARNQPWIILAFAVPLQSRRNNRGLSSHELFHETEADEKDGHAGRRVLWKRSGINVWTAKHQVCLHNVRSQT